MTLSSQEIEYIEIGGDGVGAEREKRSSHELNER